MKTWILSLVLTATVSPLCLADTSVPQISGFLDIPFGSPPDVVKKELASRTFTRFDQAKSAGNLLRFNGGKFAGFNVTHFEIHFAPSGLYAADTFIQARSPNHEKEFATVKQMITDKYGSPDKDEMNGENHEATWHFPIPGQPANLIWIISLPHGEGVKIIYQSDATKNAAQPLPPPPSVKPAKTGNKAKDDF